MRRARIMTALLVFSVTLLSVAPAAFARADGGQGWYGETNDKVITNAMFITIIFFPTVILVFSLIQWRLDKRKHAKMRRTCAMPSNKDNPSSTNTALSSFGDSPIRRKGALSSAGNACKSEAAIT